MWVIRVIGDCPGCGAQLDQFFFSHAFGGRDARFVAAADRIKRMTHLQLSVSPYSSVHEDETHQWRGYQDKSREDLMEFMAIPVRTTCRLIWRWRGRVAGGEFTAILDSPIAATVVEHMLQMVPEDVKGPERIQRCVEFVQVPSEWISAHLFATLKEMVKRGAYTNREQATERLSGIFDDIAHVSMYAPYCDAFVMDRGPRAAVRCKSV
jgi:hypothetical protein